jgi:hypothetical protein
MNRESTGKMNHKRNMLVQARLQAQRKDLGKLVVNLRPQQQTIRRIGRVRLLPIEAYFGKCNKEINSSSGTSQ